MFEQATARQLERAALAAYRALGGDYYTDLHPTSKAFCRTIDHYLDSYTPELKIGGFFLEVGSGRGRIQRLPGGHKSNLILLDISWEMLRQQTQSQGGSRTHKVLASAFRLPFADGTMDGVFSFMGDSFSGTSYYREVKRVTKRGARFLHVIPHCEWGYELRRLLGIPLDMTFFLQGGRKVVAPSLLRAPKTIRKELEDIGFTEISFRDLCLPSDYPFDSIPEHILLPSRSKNLNPYELKILLVVEARAS